MERVKVWIFSINFQHTVTPYPAWSRLVCVEQKSPETPTFCENDTTLKSPLVVTCNALASTFDWPWLSNAVIELPDWSSPVKKLHFLAFIWYEDLTRLVCLWLDCMHCNEILLIYMMWYLCKNLLYPVGLLDYVLYSPVSSYRPDTWKRVDCMKIKKFIYQNIGINPSHTSDKFTISSITEVGICRSRSGTYAWHYCLNMYMGRIATKQWDREIKIH